MSGLAWYLAGLGTLPLLAFLLNRLLPRRQQVDAWCLYCGDRERFDTHREAMEYGRAHIHACEKHPLGEALNRLREIDAGRIPHGAEVANG